MSKKETIDVFLEKSDVEKLIAGFHFDYSKMAEISNLYEAILPLLKVTYFKGEMEGNDEVRRFAVAMTLGSGIDELQQLYLNNEAIEEAYMVDCIGSELLMKAYSEVAKRIQEETGFFVTKMDFLGDEYPISFTEELFSITKPEGISYNEAFVLTPSKSVTMIISVSNTRPKNDPCHICISCRNYNCIFNENHEKKDENEIPLTYGSIQILGKRIV